jgi:hypothetical protein
MNKNEQICYVYIQMPETLETGHQQRRPPAQPRTAAYKEWLAPFARLRHPAGAHGLAGAS